MHWLKNGDKNTRFFHKCIKQRRKKNVISQIIDEEGRTWSSPREVEKAFSSYFQHIFTSSNPVGVDDSLNLMLTRVIVNMNSRLIHEPTMEEVHAALSQMDPMKAPGPDGFLTSLISKLSQEFPRRSVLIPIWDSLLWLENLGSGSSK